MRNLKKILALVLALMMVLSVMVTASAASFTDADEINADYAEAVGVLSGIGVIRGIENADGTMSFKPTDSLNRAQAATIISYILEGTLDNIDTLVDAVDLSFTDVPAWAEPYVAYCASEGIIVGRNATTYDPYATVTGYEFGKMLLVAAGLASDSDFVNIVYIVDGVEYEDYLVAALAASNTGATLEKKTTAKSDWKVTVSSELKTNGIWGSEFALSKKLTREEACYLAFNTMVETHLMSTVFPTVSEVTEDLGADELGRPVASLWTMKGKPIYVDYEDALKTVYGATYKPAVDTPAKTWDFTGATYLYNGAPEANWNGSDLTKAGVTSELYGYYDKTTQKYVVETVVSTEYYYATIANVAANGNITLAVSEAGYVIGNSGAATITVSAAKDATTGLQSDNYLALAGYAKGTALAVLVAPGWENELTILDVVEPETVTGTVTSAAISGYYEGYVVVNGTKYAFANEYSQAAVDVGSDGTFYLLNGLVIGFVGTAAPDAVTDTVYVVDHYATYVPKVDAVTDAYGTVLKAEVPAYYLISAQGVNMDGEIVTYPVATAATDTSADSTYTAYEQSIKLFTATATGIYTVGTATNVAPITVGQYTVSYNDGTNNYYYNNAEYVSLLGAKSTLTVSAGTKAAAVSSANAWAVYGQTTSTNKTVSKIFYWNASAGAPVPENVFVYFGDNTVPEKSVITLADGTTKVNVYSYDVYEAGEAKTILSYNSALVADYYEYYVDDYGICVVSELDGVMDTVDNIYGNYVTIDGVCADYDITGIKVVDLTLAATGYSNAGNGTIEAGETVVFYAVQTGATTYYIDCIYIVDSPAD